MIVLEEEADVYMIPLFIPVSHWLPGLIGTAKNLYLILVLNLFPIFTLPSTFSPVSPATPSIYVSVLVIFY